tara:strand:- start:143 stop:346 length:204 start_codon:yes stop_codon:yes gene_type:complete
MRALCWPLGFWSFGGMALGYCFMFLVWGAVILAAAAMARRQRFTNGESVTTNALPLGAPEPRACLVC